MNTKELDSYLNVMEDKALQGALDRLRKVVTWSPDAQAQVQLRQQDWRHLPHAVLERLSWAMASLYLPEHTDG